MERRAAKSGSRESRFDTRIAVIYMRFRLLPDDAERAGRTRLHGAPAMVRTAVVPQPGKRVAFRYETRLSGFAQGADSGSRAMATPPTISATLRYLPGASGFSVTSRSHLMMNCVNPPNMAMPMAYKMPNTPERLDRGRDSTTATTAPGANCLFWGDKGPA